MIAGCCSWGVIDFICIHACYLHIYASCLQTYEHWLPAVMYACFIYLPALAVQVKMAQSSVRILSCSNNAVTLREGESSKRRENEKRKKKKTFSCNFGFPLSLQNRINPEANQKGGGREEGQRKSSWELLLYSSVWSWAKTSKAVWHHQTWDRICPKGVESGVLSQITPNPLPCVPFKQSSLSHTGFDWVSRLKQYGRNTNQLISLQCSITATLHSAPFTSARQAEAKGPEEAVGSGLHTRDLRVMKYKSSIEIDGSYCTSLSLCRIECCTCGKV